MKIKWLHISDLHFGLDNYFINEARRKIISYIKENFPNEEFNYLFITGDLKYSKVCKDYPEECKEFISNLAESIGVKNKNIFIVCGNHDIERVSARKDVRNGILQDYSNNKFRIDDSRYRVLKNSQSKFVKHIKNIVNYDVQKKIKNNPHIVIQDEFVNILLINSSLICCEDGERGHLLYGREYLQTQMDTLDRNKITIALAHHPFDWFKKDEAEQLECILKDYDVLLYLCGHQHVAQAKNIQNINQTKDLHEIACGAFINDETQNGGGEMGISIGEFDFETYEGIVQAFLYQTKFNNGWNKDNNFAKSQNNNEGDYIVKFKKKL